MDTLSQEQRSRNMARISGRNTVPELKVRLVSHRLGFRFRIHRKDLPGTPDLVFPRFRKVIFVHGCFWHRHPGCRFSTTPKTRPVFWREKFGRNVQRDIRNIQELESLGWKPIIMWECEIRDTNFVEEKLQSFWDEI